MLVRAIITAAALSAAAASCSTYEDNLLLRESPSFQAGYGDGCVTAGEEDKSFSTRNRRDAYAFDNDEAYRAGWRQGYLECEARVPDANDGGRILGERNEY